MGGMEKEVKLSTEFTVVQLPYHYPDDTIMDTLRNLTESMVADGWSGVGVIDSMNSQNLYVVFEKPQENKDDHLSESQEARPRQA